MDKAETSQEFIHKPLATASLVYAILGGVAFALVAGFLFLGGFARPGALERWMLLTAKAATFAVPIALLSATMKGERQRLAPRPTRWYFITCGLFLAVLWLGWRDTDILRAGILNTAFVSAVFLMPVFQRATGLTTRKPPAAEREYRQTRLSPTTISLLYVYAVIQFFAYLGVFLAYKSTMSLFNGESFTAGSAYFFYELFTLMSFYSLGRLLIRHFRAHTAGSLLTCHLFMTAMLCLPLFPIGIAGGVLFLAGNLVFLARLMLDRRRSATTPASPGSQRIP